MFTLTLKPDNYYEVKYRGTREDFHENLTNFLTKLLRERIDINLSVLDKKCKHFYHRNEDFYRPISSYEPFALRYDQYQHRHLLEFQFLICSNKLNQIDSIGDLSQPTVVTHKQLTRKEKLLLLL